MIVGNTAYDGGGVRFCYFTGALPEPTIRFNAVYDNHATGTGGGVTVCDADVVIENCTIDGNGAGSTGGGVYVTTDGIGPILPTTIVNSIVANSTSGGGVVRDAPPIATSRCDVGGNAGGNYVNCAPGIDDFSLDPLYCDPAGRDLELRDDSPCLPDNNSWGVLVGAYGAGGCGTSVGGEQTADRAFRLHPPFPNPSGGTAVLSYSLSQPGTPVEIAVFSVDGRLVKELRSLPGTAGEHRVAWDGTDDTGHPVASGVYLVRGSAGGRTDSRGIVLIRGQ